jgi:hypothetical protein
VKSNMHHFGELPLMLQEPKTQEQIINEQSSFIITASDLASTSLNRTLTKAEMLAKSQEIQDFIKENGLEPYLRDVTRERIIQIFALVGMYQSLKLIRSKVGAAALGGFLLFFLYSKATRNTDKITEKTAEKAAEEAIKDKEPQTVVLPSIIA